VPLGVLFFGSIEQAGTAVFDVFPRAAEFDGWQRGNYRPQPLFPLRSKIEK